MKKPVYRVLMKDSFQMESMAKFSLVRRTRIPRLQEQDLCGLSVLPRSSHRKFKEGVDGLVRLPEDDIETFDHFLTWLYSGSVPLESPEGILLDADAYWCPFVWLYVLADKLGVLRLKNDIIDRIVLSTGQGCCAMPWTTSVKIAYDNLPNSSGLRLLLPDLAVHLYALNWEEVEREAEIWVDESDRQFLAKDCPDFAFDVLLRFGKSRDKRIPIEDRESCMYHEHSALNTPGSQTECHALEEEE